MASLLPIVRALGGELWDGGRRAVVRAPGHSQSDRSVSLMLSGDRVVIHSFGSADWRDIRSHLLDLGLIDHGGRAAGCTRNGDRSATLRPDALRRTRIALALWDEAGAVSPGSASMRHLVRRLGSPPPLSEALRHHPAAAVSVFGEGGPRLPALLVRVSDARGALSAVEIAYLTPDGRAADGLRLRRKTVGAVPPGAAVRLSQPAERLLVGEGVMTVLSAAARFDLPAWALLSARNLAAWSPPPEVRHVLIAGDRGPAGEQAAAKLAERLRLGGVASRIALPAPAHGDWNEAAIASGRREEGR
ncbi:MAG TPA: toprim domain-containing protein [Brevundimonas sp.]|nr:toprim domain-containing protein [Brevundimonas sp.]